MIYHIRGLIELFKRQGKLQLILLFFSLNVMIISISTISISNDQMKEFGLATALPPLYFVGLLTFISIYLSIVLCSSSKFNLIFSTVMLILVLFGTATLIEQTPRNGYGFRGAGIVDHLDEYGHISTSYQDIGLLAMYQNWPAAFIQNTVIYQFSGIDMKMLLIFVPILSRLLYFTVLLGIFSILFSNFNKATFACAFFFLMDWVNQEFLSSQNFGYYFFLVIILVVLLSLKYPNRILQINLLLILSMIAVIISHGLSSITAMLFVFASLSFPYLFRLFYERRPDNYWSKLQIGITCLLLMLSWSLYGVSDDMMNTGIERAASFDINNVIDKYQQTEKMGQIGSESRATLATIKEIDALFFGVLGLFGLLIYLNKTRHEKRTVSVSIYLCLTIIAINIVLFASQFYGREGLIRAYFFSLIPLTYFSLFLLKDKRTLPLLLLFFIISAPIHIVLHYGNESFYYYSPEAFAGSDFFFAHSKLGTEIHDNCDIDALKNYKKYIHESVLSEVKQDSYVFTYRNTINRLEATSGTDNSIVSLGCKIKQYNSIYHSGGFKMHYI